MVKVKKEFLIKKQIGDIFGYVRVFLMKGGWTLLSEDYLKELDFKKNIHIAYEGGYIDAKSITWYYSFTFTPDSKDSNLTNLTIECRLPNIITWKYSIQRLEKKINEIFDSLNLTGDLADMFKDV